MTIAAVRNTNLAILKALGLEGHPRSIGKITIEFVTNDVPTVTIESAMQQSQADELLPVIEKYKLVPKQESNDVRSIIESVLLEQGHMEIMNLQRAVLDRSPLLPLEEFSAAIRHALNIGTVRLGSGLRLELTPVKACWQDTDTEVEAECERCGKGPCHKTGTFNGEYVYAPRPGLTKKPS